MTPRPGRPLPRRALLTAGALSLPLLLAACSDDGTDTVSTSGSSSPSPTATSTASASPEASADATQDGGGGEVDSDASPSAGATGDTGSAADGGSGAGLPFPANTDPDTETASGDEVGTVTDVRLGDQEGYDRVVFELAGTTSPGWEVRYDDDPRTQGEGAPVDLAGDAVLHVTITGTGYPFDTGEEEYSGGDLGGDGPVTAVRFGGVYEGQTQAFIGVSQETPFRVFLEQSPTRVVVDVVDTP